MSNALNILTFELAQNIKAHLIKTNQGFTYYQGVIVSREDCDTVIDYVLR